MQSDRIPPIELDVRVSILRLNDSRLRCCDSRCWCVHLSDLRLCARLLFTHARFMRAVVHARRCASLRNLIFCTIGTRPASVQCIARNSQLARDRTPECPWQRSHQNPELNHCVKGCGVLPVSCRLVPKFGRRPGPAVFRKLRRSGRLQVAKAGTGQPKALNASGFAGYPPQPPATISKTSAIATFGRPQTRRGQPDT